MLASDKGEAYKGNQVFYTLLEIIYNRKTLVFLRLFKRQLDHADAVRARDDLVFCFNERCCIRTRTDDDNISEMGLSIGR